MKIIQTYTENLEEQARDILDIKEDIADAKAEIAIAGLLKLLKRIDKSNDEILEIQNTTEYFDKALSGELKSAIEKLGKFEDATIEFKPTINVDLKPIATAISKQNDEILKFLQKLSTPNGQQNEGLYNLIVSMVEKNNAFIDKGINQIDYSKQISSIAESIGKRPMKWEFEGYRDHNGRIKITATAKDKHDV